MTAVRVFDPAMCCSTGVCGPSVDPQLARFSADLDWLKSPGSVRRALQSCSATRGVCGGSRPCAPPSKRRVTLACRS